MLLLFILILPVYAFWRLPCSHAIVKERSDPIVSPGKVAGHVHVVTGAKNFGINSEFDNLRASTCTSCLAVEDMSAYWVAQPYFHWKNGSFTAVENGGMTIYYFPHTHPDDPNPLEAFPDGLKMLTGNPFKRQYDPKVHREDESFGWRCIGANVDGVAEPKYVGFPPINCPFSMRLEIRFPSCWDGENLDSENHASHMAYTENESSPCPSSHPRRLATLFYEFWFHTDRFSEFWEEANNPKQPFVLAQGDPTGFGLHADFQNGWDREALQKALDGCRYESGIIEECEFFTLKQTDDCHKTPEVDEVVLGTIDKLPGCNPVFAGPEDAPKKPTCDDTEDPGMVGDETPKKTKEREGELKATTGGEGRGGGTTSAESATATGESSDFSTSADVSGSSSGGSSESGTGSFASSSGSGSSGGSSGGLSGNESLGASATESSSSGPLGSSNSTPNSSSSSGDTGSITPTMTPWFWGVIGLIVAILIIGGLMYMKKKHKKRRRSRDDDDDDSDEKERSLEHPLLSRDTLVSVPVERRYDTW